MLQKPVYDQKTATPSQKDPIDEAAYCILALAREMGVDISDLKLI